MPSGLTVGLGRFIAGLRYPDIPADAIRFIHTGFTDCIGCQDAPALGYLVIGPKGLPDPICNTLGDAIRKVVEGPDFQKTLANLEIPYDYKDRSQLENETVADFYLYKTFLEKMGVKPE